MDDGQEGLSGAEVIIRSLEDCGVKEVFGYTGGAILPVFEALGKSSLSLMVDCNEQSCALAAAGLSRASGRVGVAVVTSGPAATNTLTAVADAFGDSVPLVVISGQVPHDRLGTDAFQHIDVKGIFSSAAKRVVLLGKDDDVERVVKDAVAFARSGRPGPVVIDVPKDVQLGPASYQGSSFSSFMEVYAQSQVPSDEECAAFFSLLRDASRPLLYVGGGLVGEEASGALRSFNDRFGLPHVNTLMGKGVLPEDEDYSLGMLGMFGTPEANTAIQRTDFFFALGVRWDDRVAEKVGEFALQAKIAYVDINPEKVSEIRRERRPDFTFVGDAAACLRRLTSYAKEHEVMVDIDAWREEVSRINGRFRYVPPREGSLRQGVLVRELGARLRGRDAIITTGVGNHQMFSAQRLRMRRPRSFLTSGSFGTMGFGLPTAVGACVASPERMVLVIEGDGSLKMNLGELYTIGTNRLPIKVVVFNNRSDGMVRNLQRKLYDGRFVGTSRPLGDEGFSFARLAAECGFSFSRTVSRSEEVGAALDGLLAADGPALLEFVTDKDEMVFPRIDAGKAYKEMDLGPFLRVEEESAGGGI